jgi:uracil-DNA glycosylase
MQIEIETSWKTALAEECKKSYFKKLMSTVQKAYAGGIPIYPPSPYVCNAFAHCPFDSVKVVILGQDPYHNRGQAHGLSFSVQESTVIPPSLKNIYRELSTDLQTSVPFTGDLTPWADQGVLLLNAVLTVQEGSPGSHQGIGWETFTDAVIQKISDTHEHVVFMLWGKYATEKGVHIDTTKHLVLTASHPSPLSAYRGFFGCRHFSQTNAYLRTHGKAPIRWHEV